MAGNKIATFIGFVIRSGKYRSGMNTVQTIKKANLILVCKTASENTKSLAEKVAKRLNCPVMVSTQKPLTDYTFTTNTKVLAVTDKSLAKAIIDNGEEEFLMYNPNSIL